MKDIRVRHIMFWVLLILVCLGVAYIVADRSPKNSQTSDAIDLARIAKNRYEHKRGLTPCRVETQEITRSARAQLLAMGEPEPFLLVVTVPAFSGAVLTTFGNDQIRVLHFSGDAGYTAPPDLFHKPIGKPAKVQIPASTVNDLVQPLSRHVRFAMTAPTYGMDGTSYYFDLGSSDCAQTWSPGEGDGPSALIVDLLDELHRPHPSVKKLRALMGAIDSLDRS